MRHGRADAVSDKQVKVPEVGAGCARVAFFVLR